VHGAEERGLTFTMLWHPHPRRIGLTSAQPFRGGRAAVAVARLAPVFSDGQPIADARTSRSPRPVVPGADGSVTLWPGRPGQAFSVDGAPGRGGQVLPPGALTRGVVVGLGGRGPLLLVELGLREPDRPRHGLVGPSEALARVRAEIDALAPHPYPVLVVGPTGTGKEVVSQALHAASPRALNPLVAINMAALNPGTAPSELFGHARGAFTGADRASPGYFLRAAGGRRHGEGPGRLRQHDPSPTGVAEPPQGQRVARPGDPRRPRQQPQRQGGGAEAAGERARAEAADARVGHRGLTTPASSDTWVR